MNTSGSLILFSKQSLLSGYNVPSIECCFPSFGCVAAVVMRTKITAGKRAWILMLEKLYLNRSEWVHASYAPEFSSGA
jgi:hypothetical protein